MIKNLVKGITIIDVCKLSKRFYIIFSHFQQHDTVVAPTSFNYEREYIWMNLTYILRKSDYF